MFGVDARDRSKEFFDICQTVKAVTEPVRATAAPSPARDFARAAAAIGRDIAGTAETLGRLACLVKQKNMFNDPAQEIEELTLEVKESLRRITGDIDVLAEFVEKNHSGSKQTDSHSMTIVSTLKTDVLSTTKQFADILQQRSKVCSRFLINVIYS